jgi:hypothetical protein
MTFEARLDGFSLGDSIIIYFCVVSEMILTLAYFLLESPGNVETSLVTQVYWRAQMGFGAIIAWILVMGSQS